MLILDSSPLAQARIIIDDDEHTVKTIGNVLEKYKTFSISQEILNIQSELDNVKYRENID